MHSYIKLFYFYFQLIYDQLTHSQVGHPGYDFHYMVCWTQLLYVINIALGFDIYYTLFSITITYRLDCFISNCKEIGTQKSTLAEKRLLIKLAKTHSEIFEC